jgi:DNA mismatch repair protein MutL
VKALGFAFEDFGPNTIVINGYPSELTGINEKKLFEELLEQYKINKSELSLPKKENLIRALARRTAIRPGTNLTQEEMNALIDNLFACNTPNFAPDGQLIFFILDLNKIDSFFN